MRFAQVLLVVLVAMFAVGFCVSPAQAQGDTQTPSASPDIGSLVWTFLNSPIGLSVVSLLLAFVLGKVFTKKPAWRAYADKYRPMLLLAIKQAEKQIPNDVVDVGARRMDAALKYILALESRVPTPVLKDAITAVHAEAEAVGNL